MRYLVDTNVILELSKTPVQDKVRKWFEDVPAEELYICALTIGELQCGVERMGNGKRKDALKDWVNSKLADWFAQRILPIDANAAKVWGCLKATSRTLPIIDSLIAAVALANGLVVVTRNTKDFAGIKGLATLNPWEYGQ
jgi:predicted nucleic acid-binding protein